jgi:hypothetical protein
MDDPVRASLGVAAISGQAGGIASFRRFGAQFAALGKPYIQYCQTRAFSSSTRSCSERSRHLARSTSGATDM